MSPGSPSTSLVGSLIFEAQGDLTEAGPTGSADENGDAIEGGKDRARSMYVRLFEEMLQEVISYEHHLFTSEEISCFQAYASMDYDVQYLFIRLCLRKSDKWMRLNSFDNYRSELGDNIISVVKSLCAARVSDEFRVKQEELASVNSLNASDNMDLNRAPEVKFDLFVEDQDQATLVELLQCLTVDELDKMAKDRKLKSRKKKDALIDCLLKSSSSQPTIDNFFIKKSDPSSSRQPPVLERQDQRLREMVLNQLGACVRVNADVFALFRRINLVYFRWQVYTQYTSSILTAAIVAFARKRHYFPYVYERTGDIWPDRAALCAYERVLELEAEVDALLEGFAPSGTRYRSVLSSTPVPDLPKMEPRDEDKVQGKETPRKLAARAVAKLVFQDGIYSEWTALVAAEGHKEPRSMGLERFHHGHVLTRIVVKGAEALHILQEFKHELDVLQALIDQPRWRRGRRGRWYDQRALILMDKFSKDDLKVAEIALNSVLDAIDDPDVHLVYRPMLERRVIRLEKTLKIPTDQRHTSENDLKKTSSIVIEGVRVHSRLEGMRLDSIGQVVANSPTIPLSQSQLPFPVKKHLSITFEKGEPSSLERKGNIAPEVQPTEKKGKSIWVGRDGEQVSVEILALQYYEDRGYKGFHTEGRILTTLFGLLFWDVLFAPVPGAFESPYQTAPLDIAEDTFFFSREELIRARISEIQLGRGREILEVVDDEHREKGTWCVGVRWDLFEKQEMLEIVDCFDGKALSIICRLFCEEYAKRCSGVPDLFLWNHERRECKFVEVKGPGDALQENQKLWIDVLLGANVAVEVCRVSSMGESPTKAKRRASPRKPKASKKAAKVESDTGTEFAPDSNDEVDQLLDASQLGESMKLEPTTPSLIKPFRGTKRHSDDDDDYLPDPIKRARRSS